ncbi:MAG: hypothetical protein IVW57_12900 [Ktedonobacterales bacterium]|nr:hypothetical protein [Ktedonobacterales bacterium]
MSDAQNGVHANGLHRHEDASTLHEPDVLNTAHPLHEPDALDTANTLPSNTARADAEATDPLANDQALSNIAELLQEMEAQANHCPIRVPDSWHK